MVTYSFPGKVVLVTGGSRGMGAVILEGFARAGATCVVNFYPDEANRKEAVQTAERCVGSTSPFISSTPTSAMRRALKA